MGKFGGTTEAYSTHLAIGTPHCSQASAWSFAGKQCGVGRQVSERHDLGRPSVIEASPDTPQTKRQLRLDALHERHIGLTPSLSGTFFEAASVCLDRHHDSPTILAITSDNGVSERQVDFPTPDARTLAAWANDIDTTESGAYGVCLAAVEVEEQLVAVRRAEKLTGADWYVAPVGSAVDDLEHCYRLEVSGTDAGGQGAVQTRLRQKIEQAKRGSSNLPAIATVVGFKERAIAIKRVVGGNDLV